MVCFSGLILDLACVCASMNGAYSIDIHYRGFLADGSENDAEVVVSADLLAVEPPGEADRQVALAHHARHRRRVSFIENFFSEFEWRYLRRDWI